MGEGSPTAETGEREALAIEARTIVRGILVATAVFWVMCTFKALVLWQTVSDEAASGGMSLRHFWLVVTIVSALSAIGCVAGAVLGRRPSERPA